MRLQSPHHDLFTVSPVVTEQAEQLAPSFDDLFREEAELELIHEHQPTSRQVLPPELAQLLARVVETVAKGGTVTVETIPEELTTTAAAGMLGISRPTLMKMVKHGEIPAHKVGTHTRLRTDDVVNVKQRRLEKRREAFEELRQLEDDLAL